VDVRSLEECVSGFVKGAVSVLLEQMKGHLRLEILDMNRGTLINFQAGYRGYLTFRLLQQAGFDVVNLDGKFKKTIRGGYPALIASKVPKPLR
jgi:rhodanese-related sulfurtransferase